MKLFVTASGHVTWQNTRQTALTCDVLRSGVGDYGVGTENEAVCPGCGRTLPTVCMHIDHILSKARHALAITALNASVTVVDDDDPRKSSDKFTATILGGVVSVYKLGTPSTSDRQAAKKQKLGDLVATVHTETAWENDLENLQFLCMSCNTSKKEKDFDVAFPTKATSPFLS